MLKFNLESMTKKINLLCRTFGVVISSVVFSGIILIWLLGLNSNDTIIETFENEISSWNDTFINGKINALIN